jgi:hypothetical protein
MLSELFRKLTELTELGEESGFLSFDVTRTNLEQVFERFARY